MFSTTGESVHLFGFRDGSVQSFQDVFKCILPEYHEIASQIMQSASSVNNKSTFEYKIKKADTGEIRDIRTVSEFQFDIHGKPVTVSGINQDITESKKQEKLLLELISNLEKSQRIAQLGSWKLDLESNIFTASDEGLRLFGYPPGSSPSYEDVSNCILPQSREMAAQVMQKSMAENKKYSLEIRIAKKDTGELRDLFSMGEFVFNSKGKPVSIVGINQDITERKLIEEKLLQEQLFSKVLLDSIPGIFYLYSYPELRLVAWNKQHEILFGFEPEEMEGRYVLDWHVPESRELVLKSLENAMNEGQVTIECPLVAKDGTLIPFQLTGVTFENHGQRYLIGIGTNISERKKAEDDLKESELTINSILDNSPVQIWAFDGTKYNYMNKAYFDYTGLKSAESFSLVNWTNYVHPDDLEKATSRWTEAWESKSEHENFFRLRDNEGQYRDFWCHAVPVFDEDHIFRHFLGFNWDITDRNNSEKKLYESERRYRLLVEAATVGILVLQDGFIKFVNPWLKEILGFDSELPNSASLIDFIHPDDKEIVVDSYMRRFRGEDSFSSCQFRAVTADSAIHWFEMSGIMIDWEDRPASMNFVADITDRKKAEFIHEQNFTFSKALNKIADIIIRSDNSEEILEKTNQIIGETLQLDRSLIYKVSFSENRIIALGEWLSQYHPDIEHTKGKYSSLEMFITPFNELQRTGTYIESHSNAVNPVFRMDQSADILHNRLHIKSLLWFPFVFDESGYYLFTLNQILEHRNWSIDEIKFVKSATKHLSLALIKIKLLEERKVADDLLRKSESSLSEAQHIARIGNWEWDIGLQKALISKEMFRIYEVNPEDFDGSIDSLFTKLHPDDLETVVSRMQQMAVSQLSPIEYRIILKDQSVRTIRAESRFETDESGNPVKIVGISQDVTEKKNAQEELENTLEQLRKLTQHIQMVREEERITISRELHDDLGQLLTAIKIEISLVMRNIPDNNLLQGLQNVSGMISESIKTVQRITEQLRPEIIENLGIAAAIEWYTDDYSKRTGKEVQLFIVDGFDLKPKSAIDVYRIIQESLTNVARHAEATQIKIHIDKTATHITISISDNGVGITESQIKSKKSFGIIGMKERALALGGNLEIYSVDNLGTTLELTFPGVISEPEISEK